MARFVAQRADAPDLHEPTPHSLRAGSRIDARLRVPATPSSLSLVRHTVAGIGTALGLGPSEIADVRLALTEALSTAIRRCEDRPGEVVDVRVEHEDELLRVTVSDHGRSLPITGELPLPLVAAVTDAVELTHLPGGGTAVALSFRLTAGAAVG